MDNRPIKGVIFALGGALLFATKAIFVKLAYNYDVDSVSLLTLRMLISLPFFLAIGWYAIRDDRKAWSGILNHKWKIAAFGILGYYVASFFDLEGLQYIDASLERIILFTYPTLVLLFNYLFKFEQPSRVQVVAIFITYIGIFLAFFGNLHVNEIESVLVGGGLVVIAAVTYALYIVGTGRLTKIVDSKMYNSFAMTAAALAIISHNLISNGFNLFSFAPQVYWYAMLISIFSTVIPSYLIVEGIKIIGGNRTSIIGSIGPIATIIMAIIILQEVIVLEQWIGTIIVVCGIMLVLRKRRPKPEEVAGEIIVGGDDLSAKG